MKTKQTCLSSCTTAINENGINSFISQFSALLYHYNSTNIKQIKQDKIQKSMKLKSSMKQKIILSIALGAITLNCIGQSLPSSIVMQDIPGGTFTMGSDNLIMGSPAQQTAAPEHQVSASPYSMSEAEITNAQYIEFLNAAFSNSLIEIITGTMGPDNGQRLVQGTSSSNYNGKVLYTLDGKRVLKDHDDADGDNNSHTGDVEPENPLNICYIGFNNSTNTFYVKNPHDTSDFNWGDICNYQDYGTTQNQTTGPVLNDFLDWAGAGQNLSNELQGWTEGNPSAATNLPNQAEVSTWPVTYIRWWGAKAFADYYNVFLPTEAQWEFAAKAGQNFEWATYNGTDRSEANWNQLGMGTVALGHVREAISGTANPFGLYNLAGNCWEWIADNYVAPYDTNPITDPLMEIVGSTSRCWRGGSWNYHEATLQSSIRFYDEENRGNDHFGFRITGKNSTLSIIETENSFKYFVYPNPTSGFVIINIAEPKAKELRIFSVEGKLQYKGKVLNEIIIDVRNWQKGLYLIRIENVMKKIIVN